MVDMHMEYNKLHALLNSFPCQRRKCNPCMHACMQRIQPGCRLVKQIKGGGHSRTLPLDDRICHCSSYRQDLAGISSSRYDAQQ